MSGNPPSNYSEFEYESVDNLSHSYLPSPPSLLPVTAAHESSSAFVEHNDVTADGQTDPLFPLSVTSASHPQERRTVISSGVDSVFSNLCAKPSMPTKSLSSANASPSANETAPDTAAPAPAPVHAPAPIPAPINTSITDSVSVIPLFFISGRSSETFSPDAPPSYDSIVGGTEQPDYIDNTFYSEEVADAEASRELNCDSEVMFEGLPVGSWFSFVAALLISITFQLAGFVFIYVLSMSHAGRAGATSGLGITVMQLGLYLHSRATEMRTGVLYPSDDSGFDQSTTPTYYSGKANKTTLLTTEFLSYMSILVGWLIIVKSCASFMQLKRLERLVLSNPEAYIA